MTTKCYGGDASLKSELPDKRKEGNRRMLQRMRPLLLDPSRRFYAVLDGAQFEDLPARLLEVGLTHRSLYRERGDNDAERIRTAPQLLSLNQFPTNRSSDRAELVDQIFALVGTRPAAAFWECADGEDVLYRHLRGINMVLLPRMGGQPVEAADDSHVLQLFRHADCNVLAQVIPVLDEHQFARMLGPAQTLYFCPDDKWGGGTKQMRAVSRERPSGFLTLSREQVADITETRSSALDEVLVAAVSQGYSKRAFAGFESDHDAVRFYRRQAAREHGMVNDQHVMDYLEMVLARGKDVSGDRYFRAVMARPCLSMEEKCRILRDRYVPLTRDAS